MPNAIPRAYLSQPQCLCIVTNAIRPRPNVKYLGTLQAGDRASWPEEQARRLEAQGLVRVLTKPIRQEDVVAAGGMEAYLTANPKQRIVSKDAEGFARPQALRAS